MLAGPIPCTLLTVVTCGAGLGRMDLFDKLNNADPPIVRSSGDIVKCMDDQREGFQVGAARCSSSSTMLQLLRCRRCCGAGGQGGATATSCRWVQRACAPSGIHGVFSSLNGARELSAWQCPATAHALLCLARYQTTCGRCCYVTTQRTRSCTWKRKRQSSCGAYLSTYALGELAASLR